MSGYSDTEWGRLLQKLEDIDRQLRELRERSIFRLDKMEERLEEVEKQLASKGWVYAAADRALWAIAAAGAVYFIGGV